MIRPRSISIDAQLLNIIADIDEFKGRWEMLGKLAPERLMSLRRVATIESAGSSNHIEGARLSDHDMEKLLANLDMRSFRSRDEEEVAGYDETKISFSASWNVSGAWKNCRRFRKTCWP